MLARRESAPASTCLLSPSRCPIADIPRAPHCSREANEALQDSTGGGREIAGLESPNVEGSKNSFYARLVHDNINGL